MAICQCDVIQADESTVREFCGDCGKPILAGRKGSFTHWLFRSTACECENPSPRSKSRRTSETEDTATSSPFLELNSNEFPLERYKPLALLGEGGAGAVYLGWDEHLIKQVAVKILLYATEETAVMFQREAKVTARFKHPNVVSILDFGITSSGTPFMVLEHVPGISLDQLLKSKGTPDSITAVRIFLQIADALGHGHNDGIYHRDIKASNVLLTSDSEGDCKVQIIDFGVAAMIGGGKQSRDLQGRTLVGTPKYMPPDQVTGVYDARSEIYSLGCLMYELLTGQAPFDSEDFLELLRQHSSDPVRPFSEVCTTAEIPPPELEAIVMKCLEKDPANRFQDMPSLTKELKLVERQLQNQLLEHPHHEDQVLPSLFGDIPVVVSTPEKNANRAVVPYVAGAVILVMCTLLVFVNRSVADKSSPLPQLAKRDWKDAVTEGFDDYEQQKWFAVLPGIYQARHEVHEEIADEDFRQLQNKHVTGIIVPYSASCTGTGFELLRDQPLSLIQVTCPSISNEGMNCMLEFRTLRKLTFSMVPNLTSATLRRFTELPLLEEVTLSNEKVPTDTLAILSGSKRLKAVNIYKTEGISKQDLEFLMKMPSLESLGITGVKMQDVIPIAAKCHLSALSVPSPDMTDELLKPLLSTRIQYLNLSGSQISGQGLMMLTKMKSLKTIWLEKCSNLAKSDIGTFRKATKKRGTDIRY